MSVFSYTALDAGGNEQKGTIDAVNIDVAIVALQRRGLIISNIESGDKPALSLRSRIPFFDRVTNSDLVILSRQITTLFEAQVSALRAFRLLAAEARTHTLAEKLSAVADEIQSGSPISTALSRQGGVFSPFYINMVRAGEETGKLDETFAFLADYLDRNYEITQKARNALIYPAFVMTTFVVVMVLMMTLVVPHLASMLNEVGQDIPAYTKIVIGISTFFADYILLILIIFLIGAVFLVRYSRTPVGKVVLSHVRLKIPYLGSVYQKLFLSRIADNLSTMLKSGIQILRGIEITGTVVGDPVYEEILASAAREVKGGLPVSEALRRHPEMPGIVIAMIKIGEETGNMGNILDTMAKFYRREVNNAIDTLVGLIEPFMIVFLAVGVAVLLAAILIPIYNIASGF
ncbi:MAG: Type II secretion system F domain protein [Parcubacteria group bacterium GW2011_GWA2_46_39]|nr:MAG: Type II secretion system F domain protein [Parcubacteria group bacterium GW2011_GWA2_46_39]